MRTEPFEPAPEWTAAQLAAEGIAEQRWWTLDEFEAPGTVFAPRRLSELLRDLLWDGPPPEPVDVGVWVASWLSSVRLHADRDRRERARKSGGREAK
ncbi:MAG TPA: hypothetical protein VEL10_07290 [Gaiellaceae bacterium]|nr:hypothetical protein [Gaiellaceae bacterium]